MFQFPGFALKTLCIQVLSTCFSSLMTAPKCNINELSGGLPHSEICGSKPILGSPQLIAEYHVLHRLLLPRHSPNALFALDLIRKTTDAVKRLSLSDQSILSQHRRWFTPVRFCAISRSHGLVYLTWTKLLFDPIPKDQIMIVPHKGDQQF